MVFDFLTSSAWLVGVYLPVTTFSYQPQSESAQSLLSVTGLGAQFGYGFNDTLVLQAGYELNYHLGSKNIYLHGYDVGARHYLIGGLGLSKDTDVVKSFVVPRNSLYWSFNIARREFDLTNENKVVNQITTDDVKTYDGKGNFLGAGLGIGVEHVILSDRFRVNAEVNASYALSVSTALSILQYQGRFGLCYQL